MQLREITYDQTIENGPTVELLRRLPSFSWRVDGIIKTMHKGKGSIHFPERDYHVIGNNNGKSLGGEVVTNTKNSPKVNRVVGFSLDKPGTKSRNNLRRELVIIIGGVKTYNCLEDSRCILFLRDMVLRIAGSDELKAKLAVLARQEQAFFNALESYKQVEDFSKLENHARQVYESFLREFKIRDYEQKIIKFMSWEWKTEPPYYQYPYCCRCWILVMCFLKLIRF